MSSTTGRNLKLRGAAPPSWTALASGSIVSVVAVGLISGGLVDNLNLGPVLTGAVLAVIGFPVLLYGLSRTLRSVKLTEEVLRIPTPFGSDRVAISAIAGIGMLYRFGVGAQAIDCWIPEVWDTEGRRYEIARFTKTTRKKIRGSKRKAQVIEPGPAEAKNLSGSSAGRMAAKIYDWVIEQQGEEGPLATQALQKVQSNLDGERVTTVAWWSPDETMGLVR